MWSIYLTCESCNIKFHSNCHDGEFCPNCGWNKFQLINSSLTRIRSKANRNGFDGDENRMYCKMVDELKSNQEQNQKDNNEETIIDDAWVMLDRALNDDAPDEKKSIDQEEVIDFKPINPESEQLKRPNSVTHSLTMDALTKHDITNGNQPKGQISKSRRSLNYIQKLIIYRLLIKPRIPTTIPIHHYTKISKNISRKFYDLINNNKYAMLSLNSLIEFSEREGITLKDKKSIDSLDKTWNENSIIKNFINGGYLNNELGQNWIQRLIGEEINKLVKD